MLKLTKAQIIKLLLLYSFLTATAWLCFNFKRLWGPPRKRPFQCFDESLSRPFVEEDTIPPQQLNMLAMYMPIIFLAVSELCLSFCQRNPNSPTTWLLKGLLKYAIVLSIFLLGLAVERFTKNFGKQKMVRLRPNFLTVCEPINSEGIKCMDADDTLTMSEYQCSSNSYPKWAVKTAFHSFPSGHASLSAYGMIFMACYLHLLAQQLKQTQAFAFRILQIWCVLAALFVAASRVFDYRHHLSDVCAGFILGSSVAFASSWYYKSHLENINGWLRKVFKESDKQDSIKISRVNGSTLSEKETSYNMV